MMGKNCYWGRLQINLPTLCTSIKLYYSITLVTYGCQKQKYSKQNQFSNEDIRAIRKYIRNNYPELMKNNFSEPIYIADTSNY